MYKNILLEYCQKNKIKFPNFDSKNIGQKPHIPIWYSTVDFNGESFEGEVKKTKIDAEQSVCKKILDNIDLQNKSIKKISLLKKTILIIDIENNYKYSSIFEKYENLEIVGICSRNSTSKNIPFKKIVVESLANDSADIAIIIYITNLFINCDYQSIILLTRDHFGKTLEEVIKSSIFDFKPILKHFITEKEITDFLEKDEGRIEDSEKSQSDFDKCKGCSKITEKLCSGCKNCDECSPPPCICYSR